MKLFLNREEFIDTEKPLDISIPMVAGITNLRAWYVEPPSMEPVMANGFVGSVKAGGSVNFRNIFFNPHGHGTHTECLGHITKEVYSVNKVVKNYFCKAQLITLNPEEIFNEEYKETDHIITAQQLENIRWQEDVKAVIIRTLPNPLEKMHKDYSASNPPYMDVRSVNILDQLGIQHLMIDTPSVDRETDGGKLLFHHAFWGVPNQQDFNRTITELIYIEENIEDGVYILELQMAPFENDASPSRPVLYEIKKG